MGFKHNEPGEKWLVVFVYRHKPTIKRRVNLKRTRHQAMTPEIIGKHFAKF